MDHLDAHITGQHDDSQEYRPMNMLITQWVNDRAGFDMIDTQPRALSRIWHAAKAHYGTTPHRIDRNKPGSITLLYTSEEYGHITINLYATRMRPVRAPESIGR